MRLTYSVNEVAELLGVSRSKVYVLMNEGHLFYIQPQGWRLIPAEALQAFTRGQKFDPNADLAREQQADVSTWPPTYSLLGDFTETEETAR